MPDTHRKKWRRITLVYWMLLGYIIAALVWWFISLEKQNSELSTQRYALLEGQRGTLSPGSYEAERIRIQAEYKRNTGKYLGEGVTFLILILVGAAFVYRSVRRQYFLQQQQQSFMMAVTHELKTPISVARLNLETLQKHHLDPEKQKKLIRNTLDETTRLNFLTNNILIASQLEGGRYHLSREELDLSDLLKNSLQDFRNRYPEREFSEDIEPDADIKGDPLLLQILISNLVENAIKYSPKDSPVSARLHKIPGGIVLHVLDQGPGIPEEERKKIFNRFYRIGNEATRTKQGTGLGLYLCRIIARDHNADISVTNNDPCGSNFAVQFST